MASLARWLRLIEEGSFGTHDFFPVLTALQVCDRRLPDWLGSFVLLDICRGIYRFTALLDRLPLFNVLRAPNDNAVELRVGHVSSGNEVVEVGLLQALHRNLELT